MTRSWTDNWKSTLEPGIGRLEFLMELRAAVQIAATNATHRVDRPSLDRLLAREILNSGQLGALLNISPQQVRNIGRERGGLKSRAPKGVIDAYGLDWLYLIVQKLASGSSVQPWQYDGLLACGDISIVSYLSGIPQHVIVRHRKTQENFDAAQYRQRVADDQGIYPRTR